MEIEGTQISVSSLVVGKMGIVFASSVGVIFGRQNTVHDAFWVWNLDHSLHALLKTA